MTSEFGQHLGQFVTTQVIQFMEKGDSVIDELEREAHIRRPSRVVALRINEFIVTQFGHSVNKFQGIIW